MANGRSAVCSETTEIGYIVGSLFDHRIIMKKHDDIESINYFLQSRNPNKERYADIPVDGELTVQGVPHGISID